jgi:hypothetical protein
MSDSRQPGLRLSPALNSLNSRRRRHFRCSDGGGGFNVPLVVVAVVILAAACRNSCGCGMVPSCTALAPAAASAPPASAPPKTLFRHCDNHVSWWQMLQKGQRKQGPLCVLFQALPTATTDPLYQNTESTVNDDDDNDDDLIITHPPSLAVHATSLPPVLAAAAAAAAAAAPPTRIPFRGAVSMSVNELAWHLGGLGRAKLVWDCYRIGVDPLMDKTDDDDALSRTSTIASLLPSSRRTQRLGVDALDRLATLYADYSGGTRRRRRPDNQVPNVLLPPPAHTDGILASQEQPQPQQPQQPRPCGMEGGVAVVSHVVQSTDGTTKLLLTLWDGTAVETVLIPNYHTRRTTVCVSSQVGCRQACTFCATGRMGRVRSLSADEILAQYYFALQTVRRSKNVVLNDKDDGDNNTILWSGLRQELPPITNVGTFVAQGLLFSHSFLWDLF